MMVMYGAWALKRVLNEYLRVQEVGDNERVQKQEILEIMKERNLNDCV